MYSCACTSACLTLLHVSSSIKTIPSSSATSIFDGDVNRLLKINGKYYTLSI